MLSLSLAFLLSACASVDEVENNYTKTKEIKERYSLFDLKKEKENKATIVLAFSGGGARASALSYGILEELQNTTIKINGEDVVLGDEIDLISSVSGGSFTSAYYGLYPDDFYTKFKDDFLYQDISDELFSLIVNPINIFSNIKRVDRAKFYYKENIFGDATFEDINKKDGPFIMINASDISTGLRFSFIQEYFDLLCSNVNDYPIADAVTASAAVPILFEPITLKNHNNCDFSFKDVEKLDNETLSIQTKETLDSVEAYFDKDYNKYIHLVDGGITDNLGLLAIYDFLELSGFHKKIETIKNKRNKDIIIISVDASTNPELNIGSSIENPSITQTLNSITDIQLHRYNYATKKLFIDSIDKWSNEVSINNDNYNIEPHFIDINFGNTLNEEDKYFFNQVPTDMSLEKETIDRIIKEARQQLKNNESFKKAINNIKD